MAPLEITDNRSISPEVLEKLRSTIIECFADGQFHEVGIRDICKKAQVSPNTVYKYYGSKEELLYSCIRGDMEALNQRALAAYQIEGSIRERTQAFADAWFDYYENNPIIARVVFLNIPLTYWVSPQHFMQANFQKSLVDTMAQLQRQGLISAKVPVDHMLEMAMGAATRLIVRWLTSEQGASLQEFKRSFVLMLSNFLHPDA